MNLFSRLQETAQLHPTQVAFQFQDQSLTYKELVKSSEQIAQGLAQHGIHQGVVVALLIPNHLEFIQSYFAIQKLGAVALPINLLLTPTELKFILQHSQAKMVIAHEIFVQKLKGIQNQLESLQKIVQIATNSSKDAIDFRTLLECDETLPKITVDHHDLSTILYTSGTTDSPKGVMISHENFMHSGHMLQRAFDLTHHDKELIVVPLFHIFALAVLHATIQSGATAILLDQFDPKSVLKFIKDRAISIFYGVPTMYGALVQAGQKQNSNSISSLRICISGGAPLPVEISKQFKDTFGLNIAEGYGLTEVAGGASFNPYQGKIKVGSIGKVIWGHEMKIVDENGHELPINEVGEIAIKGKNVMLGYLNNEKATQVALRQGWLYTGDLAYQDEEGYFTIVDRKKDLIIVGGENVYPREVEEALYQFPGVLEAAVLGVPHEKMGEAPKAYIVLEPGQEPSSQKIINFLETRLAKFKIPRQIEFKETLPKNATGKILRRALKEKPL